MTDRYELAMLGAYLREGIADRRAVFELYVRKLPKHRNFMLVVGIDRISDYIWHLGFDEQDIDYLCGAPGLKDVMTTEMVSYLRHYRFTGNVDSMLEGQIAFGGEPILRVEASLGEAQILETFMLGVINHETKVASKAARVVLAAQGLPVSEFGARRIDPAAAEYASRAAYIAGCKNTSFEDAGYLYGIPVSGTCAHSYMLAHVDGPDREQDAFNKFAEAFPSGTRPALDLLPCVLRDGRLLSTMTTTRREFHTFWLLTHPCGKWVKGEGATDEEALRLALTHSEQHLASLKEDNEKLMATAKVVP